MPSRVTEAMAAEHFKLRGGTLVRGTWVNTQKPCTVVCDTCHEPHDTVRYNDVVNKGTGICKGICRSKKISKVLKTPDAEARPIMRNWNWDPSPLEPFPGAGKPWMCRCMDCGTEYPKMLSHVQVGDGGCRHCQGQDISEAEAIDVMRANEHEPIDPYPGSQAPWPAWCLRCRAKGRSTVTTAYLSRIKYRGHQCWTCRGEKIGDALRYTKAEARSLMRSFGYDPLVDYPGSVDEPWRCIHRGTEDAPCGRMVKPTLHHILGGRGGCSPCAHRGPDYAAAGYLYVVTRGMTGKIGIGGSLVRKANDRLRAHARQNWIEEARWSFTELLEAHTIEQAVQRWLSDQDVTWLAYKDMPYGGYTETFSLNEVPAARVIDFITQYARRPPDNS